MAGEHPEAPGRRTQLLEQVEVEQHRPDAEPFELFGGGQVRTGPVEHDEIRPPGGYRLDARRHAVADARHGEHLGWIVAPGGATHEPVARADREEDLGERGKERHDAPGGRGERDRKSTRLNSSHSQISYAVFCLKKKTYNTTLLLD